MEIRTYRDVDPLQVLKLNMTVLGFPLSPDLAAALRTHDRRMLDEFCFYAEVAGEVAGQAGLLVNTVETTASPMRLGAAWAVCTLPSYSRQGVARALMEQVEQRARELGCSGITLGTSRWRVAHRLYSATGYQDLLTVRQAYRFERPDAPADQRLTVRRAAAADLPGLEQAFFRRTSGLLGFVRRQPDFLQAALHGGLDLSEIHGVCRDGQAVGYMLARPAGEFLRVRCALLPDEIALPHAISALAALYPAPYIQISDLTHPHQIRDLEQSGYAIEETWGTFMLKSLTPGLDWNQLLGVTAERFFVDCLDFT